VYQAISRIIALEDIQNFFVDFTSRCLSVKDGTGDHEFKIGCCGHGTSPVDVIIIAKG
jgi:hypothetical protein